MTAMTRAEIKRAAMMTLGEYTGTPGGQSDFLYDTLINQATNDVARSTDCYCATVGADLVANQPEYCLPQLYKIRGVQIQDAGFNYRPLILTTPQQLDMRFGAGLANWRNQPAGTPQWFATRGDNLVVLVPTPSTSTFVYAYTDLVIGSNNFQVTSAGRPFVSGDAGYTLRVSGGTGFSQDLFTILSVASGIATVNEPLGTALSTAGAATLSNGGLFIEGWLAPGDTWPGDTDECPLPDRAHIAVMWRTCVLRTIQFPSAENMARLPMVKEEYATALGLLEAETVRLTPATQHGDIPSRPLRGRRW